MGSMPSVANVVVIPRNGYANRLQAWASAAIVARTWGVPLKVCWENEAVCPADASSLFRSAGEGSTFISSDEVEGLLGGSHEGLPRYLTHDSDSGGVTLAGHDRGEQPFMADLAQLALDSAEALTVVFIAGGRFWLPGETAFNVKRRDFYGSINWSEPIAEQVSIISADHEPYIGIHVRGTDKAITVPTEHAMERAIAATAEQSGLSSVLVAADTAQTRSRWVAWLEREGMQPWFVKSTTHDRTSRRAGVDALVEWNLLARSTAMVFANDSSFGHEAALCTRSPEVNAGLTAPAWLQKARVGGDWIRSAITYPVRHCWIGRQ